MKHFLLWLVLGICCANATAAETQAAARATPCGATAPALCPVAEVPGLPRVLLIGDSISMGYTFPTRKSLDGVANVQHIPQNAGSTKIGLIKMEEWLAGDKKWDVIHVNFGLHDAQIGPDGKPNVDLETYEKNTRTILRRLKQTGAKVIWATTTPVPADVTKHKWSDVTEYNRVAVKVAQDEGVAVDDLYAVITPREKELQRSQNVHYTGAGSELLGHTVASSIMTALPKK